MFLVVEETYKDSKPRVPGIKPVLAVRQES